jgi:hypothetical protein
MREVTMSEEEREQRRDGGETEPEKEPGEIVDDASISGADAQEESGTVEGQIPGMQSRIEKPGGDDRESA